MITLRLRCAFKSLERSRSFLIQRQEFRGDVLCQKQRARGEEANALGVGDECIHYDDRGGRIPSLSHDDCFTHRWTEMNIIPITWLKSVAQDRLSEIPRGSKVELPRRLPGVKAEIHRKRMPVGGADVAIF